MSSPTDAGQYLLGKIEAVEMLASALAAHLSPAAASVILAQCAALREKAAQGKELSSYELGFRSIEERLMGSLKQASDAEKNCALSGDVSH